MTETLAGFPFWTLVFDEEGHPRDAAALDAFVKEVAGAKLTDLSIFSHGWNNDRSVAMLLYEQFFAEERKLLDDPARAKKRTPAMGVAGVVWPSIKWPEDDGGGAAALGDEGEDLFESLKTVFTSASDRAELDELEALLEERESSDEALEKFHDGLSKLLKEAPRAEPAPDDVESKGLAGSEWREVFENLGSGPDSDGGAAGLGDTFGHLWEGAKNALRVATYWKMKKRAGVVGRDGLGPLLGRLRKESRDLRIHLLGHSFGARVVSYSLAGLPASALVPTSPVKSLFLLQGAFSHYAFADVLPFDKDRKGDLAGMASRVDGPLLATHSRLDTAVGIAYPAAQVVVGEDAAGLTSLVETVALRYGAMGSSGALEVNAVEKTLAPPGAVYPFAAGRWINLDGNKVIVAGGPPSGAHSDIVHPHTAWAALAAAGVY